MDIIGASFTITLIILILAWPFLAIYIAQRIAVPRTRQGFQTYDYHDVCSNKNHPCTCDTKCPADTGGQATKGRS